MNQPVIVLGDKTSHGGTVISASLFTDTNGKGWAGVGDKVACRRCRGIFPIVQGDPSLIDDGLPVAYDGCKVACGAVLIASQGFTTDEPSGGAGRMPTSAQDSIARGFGAVADLMVAGYQDESLDPAKKRFRGRFQLIDADSGEPIVGQSARVSSNGGQALAGHTDAEGFTAWIERDANELLSFQLVDGQLPS